MKFIYGIVIKPIHIIPANDYYYTLCQICGHGARFDNIHLALSQVLLLKQASCNPRLSRL